MGCSLEKFKKDMDKYLQSEPDQLGYEEYTGLWTTGSTEQRNTMTVRQFGGRLNSGEKSGSETTVLCGKVKRCQKND